LLSATGLRKKLHTALPLMNADISPWRLLQLKPIKDFSLGSFSKN
jgi:hypothetical protein